jgi:hypothetical protein
MAKLDEVFNSAEVPEREEFTPIPPGQYSGMVVSSELKTTHKGGQMIVLEIDIQSGDYEGRKLFERLNIKNDNQKAVDIAYRTLSELVKAVGKTTIKDTEELHNKRFLMDVVVTPAKPYTKDGIEKPGSPQNDIKKFLPYAGSNAPASGSVSTPKSVESATEQKAVPPWKRKSQ